MGGHCSSGAGAPTSGRSRPPLPPLSLSSAQTAVQPVQPATSPSLSWETDPGPAMRVPRGGYGAPAPTRTALGLGTTASYGRLAGLEGDLGMGGSVGQCTHFGGPLRLCG